MGRSHVLTPYNIAGTLTVMYKIQVQRVRHLQDLWQTSRHAMVATRVIARNPGELMQPRCRTWHHQPQFV